MALQPHDFSHRWFVVFYFFPSWQNSKVIEDWVILWYVKYLMLYSPETSMQYSVVLDTLQRRQLHLRQLFIASVWSSWYMLAFYRLCFSLIAGIKTELRSLICGWILVDLFKKTVMAIIQKDFSIWWASIYHFIIFQVEIVWEAYVHRIRKSYLNLYHGKVCWLLTLQGWCSTLWYKV